MKSLSLLSPAKVNLYLKITGKRKDGFHDLISLVERISLCDRLSFKLAKGSDFHFSCSDKRLENESNLVVRAFKLAKEALGKRKKFGLKIYLEKKIPYGSGLGGGSSNAAFTLLGLNKLLRLNWGREKLFALGQKLGSDVNFFLSQASFALVSGRGEKIVPLKTNLKLAHQLIILPTAVSTASVYRAFSQETQLTNSFNDAKLLSFAVQEGDKGLLEKLLFNSLTSMALNSAVVLRSVYNLVVNSAQAEVLSGSGSSILLFSPSCPPRLFSSIKKIKGLRVKRVTTF